MVPLLDSHVSAVNIVYNPERRVVGVLMAVTVP
jgi:hypothetical protein